MKKIIITSVSAGGGHVSAAKALESVFKNKYPDVKVKYIDIMDFVSKPFKKLYTEGYVKMINKAPALWGYFYDLIDKQKKSTSTERIINKVQRYNAPKFFKFINEYNPDLILSTHFLIPQLFSKAIKKNKFNIPIDIVITDYDVHQIWIEDLVSHYYVANNAIKYKLIKNNIDEKKIIVTGIPTNPVFLKPINKSKIFKELNLKSTTKTILLLSGGFGMGPVLKTVKSICSFKNNLQIITVSGKNKKLYNELNALQIPKNICLCNLGFVKNMEELMSISDLVITKPGGLTTSECFVKGLPMIIVSPIPGQEERNADFILENGAGIKALSIYDLEFKLKELLNNSKKIEQMKKNALSTAKPYAANNIINYIFN